MHHQHRHGRVFQYVARHPAEHPLPDGTMGVAPHHQQIGLQVGGGRKKGGPCGVLAGFDDAQLGSDAMAAQISISIPSCASGYRFRPLGRRRRCRPVTGTAKRM